MSPPGRPALVSPQAEADLAAAAAYLLSKSSRTLTERFLIAAEDTFALLASFPCLGIRFPSSTNAMPTLRRHPLAHPFSSWLIFYSVVEQRVHILRVLRGERDWASLFG